jgi:serine phosphatase RsbU (regulator of sigma subunit)
MSIILITAFFIIFGYYNQLNLQEKRQYDKLSAIVTSTSIAINGDEHQSLMEDHTQKDDIGSNEENLTYNDIHLVLKKVVEQNELNTTLYTLVYNEAAKVFEFGVNSDENPFFRHVYAEFPQILLDSMDVGGTIPQYQDEHGTWLSAFYPIKNAEGNTVAILQADVDFTEFIQMVRAKYARESLIALGVIVLMAFLLIPYTRRILRQEEEQKRILKEQSEIIEEKNRDITDSINYAQKIQNSILPALSDFSKVFADFGILYKPKDIVAGDFYFMERDSNYVYIAAADCTGHGVPGAMVSVICSNALSFAINEKGLNSTKEILDVVRDIVVDKFVGSPDGIKDGMDVSLCRFDIQTNELEYTGANNPVYVVSGDNLEVLKPDKQPVGHFDYAKPFESQILQLQKNDLVYMFSDGFADQFGGEKGKKLKYKPFKEMLIAIKDQPIDSQMRVLDNKFEEWKGDFEQVDDVCVIGVKI